ncbi:zinc finger protein AEBP2 isoform X2 [Nelusetta ayraudi]|uniref:zinc finger protein AEBP2 isoform X2 n=1 Tax=Nelusetta ayraudi TaxID=303726 RepID=UPI003F6E9DF9
MAQISSDESEQESKTTSGENGAGETAETGNEGQAVPDPEQEPGCGDNNENGAGMDAVSGGLKPGDESLTPAGPGAAATADGDSIAGTTFTGPEESDNGGGAEKLSEPGGESPARGTEGSAPRLPGPEQRDDVGEKNTSALPGERTKVAAAERAEHGGTKRRASVELTSSDGEPLSRVDSEDSISSTLMDVESTASSGRSTPALLNGASAAGLGVGAGGPAAGAGGGKPPSYTCCWDQCQLQFPSSPDLAEHIRAMHVDGQRGGVFVCLWKGCKVYNTPSTSHSWLQRHMLTHSGDKPFKCVVGGCNATFASQGGLARHVPTHFSSQGSSKVSHQGRVKEESPSKAGLSKRRKLKNKQKRSLPRPHDFFDAQTMDAIRHRAICLNLATHIESLGNGHSVVFHSTVIARRKEDSGKVKVLLHWTPEDILPDVWVNESDRLQQKTKVVHLSKLPTDTAVLLDPNIYRMFF